MEGCKRCVFSLLFVCVLILKSVVAIPRDQLYPYGTDKGDERMRLGDDLSTEEIRLRIPISFYDDLHNSLYVNLNGHISFETELPRYRGDLELPLGYKLIVPFLADIDTGLSGNVYYRESADRGTLRRAEEDIQKYFKEYTDFRPRTLVIVTWEDVGYFREKFDKLNTFQVVLANDGRTSFAFFLYPENGINWVSSEGKYAPNLVDTPGQAGFDSGDTRSLTLPNSGTGRVTELAVLSNVGVNGVWAYRIGPTNGGEVEGPEVEEKEEEEKEPTTCADGGARMCSLNAMCSDYPGGFCCKCKEGFFGNGKNCLKTGADTRVNGKVEGRVNGIRMEPADLHAYVQSRGGRTYAAVSRVVPEIGQSMVTLSSMAGILGWVFAAPTVPKAFNGYAVTGGDFNRTAKVTFLATGEVMNIQQQVVGQDELGHMRVLTTLDGNLPTIPEGSRVRIDDYKEEYQRVSPGQITSSSNRRFRVGTAVNNYRWEQTITYKECEASGWDGPVAFRLKVSRNSVAYVAGEQTVRYTAANHITSIAGPANPCRDAVCDSKAKCTAVGSDYRCDCQAGYTGSGQECFDVNECSQDNECDANAECLNTEGSYECRCKRGYRGDGKRCARDLSCADLTCDRNARCVFDSELGRPKCECRQGYYGDGISCKVLEFSCNEVNNCDGNAKCQYIYEQRAYQCVCNDGYTGDGITCDETDEPQPTDPCRRSRCDQNAECTAVGDRYRCDCKEGYAGDGITCVETDEPQPTDPCRRSRCDPNAECTAVGDRYRCDCKDGYAGDGYTCVETDEPQPTEDPCRRARCDRNAECTAVGDRYRCDCREGYEGDGYRCEEIVGPQPTEDPCRRARCDRNAECTAVGDRYRCDCKEGYAGNGITCVETDEPQPTDPCRRSRCDPNAECTAVGDRYRCDCKDGYAGDGYTCVETDEPQPTQPTEDPCRRSRCDRNAQCTPVGDRYRCDCREGYEGDGVTCTDIDECETVKPCDQNADCYNVEGSFHCRCKRGYRGDGRSCEKERAQCGTLTCDENARCVYDSDLGQPKCECAVGYTGDGETCQAVGFSCNEVNNCHENAECVYDDQSRSYKCECNDGFSGDGLACEETGEPDRCGQCDRSHGECLYDPNRLVYHCQCKEGFTGDGRRCYPIVDDCSISNNCDPNADCLLDDRDGKHKCRCKYGFRGDGLSCEEEECNVVDSCSEKAECRFDNRAQRYSCVCNEGFVGDGKTCSKEEIPCNRIDNCHVNAECRQVTRGVFQCVCKGGYQGDGYSCLLALDCRRDPGICDRNAECRQHGSENVCVCTTGYRGDGRRCAPVGSADSFLMYAQGRSIMRLPYEPGNGDTGKQVVLVPGQTAIGIDADCYTRYFYWTDVAKKTISKAKMDGTDSETIVQGLSSPEGVAVDWAAGNIYWTDAGSDSIEVARADGTNRKALFNTNLMNPRAIVVDPLRGVMFWADWNRDSPKIEMASMDGSDRRTLVEDDIRLPNGLTIITEEQRLCWADAGTQHIECIGYDGRGRRVVYDLASYPFDVAFANDKFYWSDWNMRSLPNIDNYSREPNEPLDLPPGGNGRLYGITAVKDQCPAGNNACSLNSGGCRYLCLPTPGGGRTCACPDETDDEDCRRS